ncbi:MAG: LysR family transcriptional regulator [Bradyrhizobium sp.]|nr:LysR family transcriptional regulator [Bradyrhizobium sp.]
MDTFKLARISLTLLRAFDATARHLSFSRAAGELGRSQATLSVQVRELERQLDVRLLDRTTRRVALTAAGEALSQGLKEGFEAIASGLMAAREFADSRRGRVTVACVPSLSGVRLPSILAGYRRRDTVTQIEIQELTYVESVEAIIAGRVDFGIGPCTDPPPASITFSPVVDDPLCILLPASHEGELGTTAPLSMLISLPLIFLSRSAPLNRSLKEVAESQGITLNAQTKVRHVHTAIGMVRAGVGAAIVPRLALPDVVDPDLIALPINESPLTRKIGILTFRGRRLQPAAAKLARFVSSALAKTPVWDPASTLEDVE